MQALQCDVGLMAAYGLGKQRRRRVGREAFLFGDEAWQLRLRSHDSGEAQVPTTPQRNGTFTTDRPFLRHATPFCHVGSRSLLFFQKTWLAG